MNYIHSIHTIYTCTFRKQLSTRVALLVEAVVDKSNLTPYYMFTFLLHCCPTFKHWHCLPVTIEIKKALITRCDLATNIYQGFKISYDFSFHQFNITYYSWCLVPVLRL